jgi:hypothetical protein
LEQKKKEKKSYLISNINLKINLLVLLHKWQSGLSHRLKTVLHFNVTLLRSVITFVWSSGPACRSANRWARSAPSSQRLRPGMTFSKRLKNFLRSFLRQGIPCYELDRTFLLYLFKAEVPNCKYDRKMIVRSL